MSKISKPEELLPYLWRDAEAIAPDKKDAYFEWKELYCIIGKLEDIALTHHQQLHRYSFTAVLIDPKSLFDCEEC